MGIFEGITHAEEIQELLNDAQVQYDHATEMLECQKADTTKSLEELGKTKVQAWSTDIRKFLDSFGAFNNIQMVCKIDENYDFLGKDETPNQLMINMQNATYNANEIIKAGAVSVGTGALVGIATYGGVAMFAHASTGTAISALRGVAKKNATLAWLGGGAKAAGGAGIAGGAVVLGGVVIGAIAVVGGMIAGARGEARLAEAKRIHAESNMAVSKMNIAISGMEKIENTANDYRVFISKLSELFTPYLMELDRISGRYSRGSDGKVDYNALSEMEQKTVHLSWLLAQLYYHILSVPLLDDQGEIDYSCKRLLNKAKQDYDQLSGQATELENEKKSIATLLTNSKKEFQTIVGNYYKKKQSTTDFLARFGMKRINLWDTSFSKFMESLSHFENISVCNVYPYAVTEIPIEFIFESCDAVLAYIDRLKNNGIESLGTTGFVEVALFGGEDFLSELSHYNDEPDVMSRVHRHDMALWFTGELASSISNNISFGGLSEYNILMVKETIDGISGRENLAQATAINREVKDLASKINRAITDFDVTMNKTKNVEKAIKKYNKIQSEFLCEIEKIKMSHQTAAETVEYDILSETEKRVFEMSFIIAKMQYTILASCLLAPSNGGDYDESDIVITNAKNMYTAITANTFKTKTAEDLQAANVIWKGNANKALISGFAVSALLVIYMIAQLMAGNLIGLVGLGGALIAFPMFFYFKKLPQSKLFMWRCIRILTAIILIGVIELIRLVV